MRHTLTRGRPFEAASDEGPVSAGCILIPQRTTQHERQSRDARLRMDRKKGLPPRREFGVTEEQEGLGQLTDVPRCDEPCDRAAPATASEQRDTPRARGHFGR